jgi:hypothetical protein|tara:strand:+ start:868 stop:1650 length:783 start_codon:yes stop_codon:yes gene_type:complete
MSQFIDKLKRMSQVAPQPIGFKAAPLVSKPRLLLVASADRADVAHLADYVSGADAGLLPIMELASGVKRLKEVAQLAPDIPWGGLLKDSGQRGTKRIIQAGGDFIVFPSNTSLKVLEDKEVGKVLVVKSSLDKSLLKAVDELPVDAVFITAQETSEYFLTWHHLILFRHFADLLTKPFLVSVPPSVTANELQTLWEMGVDGVVVDIVVSQPAGKLKELRRMIDSLVLPSKRRWKKTTALIPRVGGEPGPVTEDEDEDGDG